MHILPAARPAMWKTISAWQVSGCWMSRRGLRLCRQDRKLLRHAHAGCRQVGYISQDHEEQYSGGKGMGADTVISSCPACDMMWRHVYPVWAKKPGIDYDITGKHYARSWLKRSESGEFTFPRTTWSQTVTWHDSCTCGRVSGMYDAPRKLIRAIPNVKLVEMENNRENAPLLRKRADLDKRAADSCRYRESARLEEAEEAGAEKVLALCPCCEFQFASQRTRRIQRLK